VGHDEEPTRTDAGPRTEGSAVAGVLAGRYRVLALLGAGGMGSVYLAEDLELGERIAVKMLRPEYARDSEFTERLRSEVRLARRVTHANVARTYDIGDHEGERFLTMEYVDGESLGKRIARDGALSLSSFYRIAEDVTAGLAAAHAAGVVHRDLKPHNILLAKSGRASITDFGTAWSRDAAHEDRVAGTPSYMAPEQFEGRFDERSDVFGLGAVFYVMLTAQKPFTGALGDRLLHAPNPINHRPGVPVSLATLVEKCLAPDPADRFATASDVGAALASAGKRVLSEERAPPTLPSGPVAGVLRGVAAEPRSLLVRGVGDAPDSLLARGLRDELVRHMNEHPLLYASTDPEREHEAIAQVEVRLDGDKLVVEVHLSGGGDGFAFWSASFEGTKADALDLPRAAARGIERALAAEVPRDPALAPLGRDATLLYLAGRAAYREFWPTSQERAAASFEEALVHSPDHPLLLSALASTRARQSFFSGGYLDQARAASELAVRLAPGLAEAHVARAAAYSQDNEAESAVQSLLRALELAPGQVDALASLARTLLEVGAPADAVRLSEAGYARDRSDLHPVTIARAHALLGDVPRATAALDRVRGEMRNTIGLVLTARFAMWRRDRPAVAAALKRLEELGRVDGAGYGLMSLVRDAVFEGRSPRVTDPRVKEELTAAVSRARRSLVRQVCAEASAYAGDFESALGSIEGAIEEGLFDTFWLERCPMFDELRGSAVFESARDVVQGRAKRVRALLHARPLAGRPHPNG
jgi:eukaryotic-like serine/threonine-protein kinase